DQDEAVHVSGHPRRGELEQLYGWVKPGIAIPMHGEGRHLEAHARLAESLGVEHVLRGRERPKLSFAGSVAVSLVLSEKGILLAEPEIALTGLPPADAQGTPFAEIVRGAVTGTIER